MEALQGILLVDSDEMFRRLVREMIVRHHPDLPVKEAPTGEDALRLAAQHRPELIFIDIDNGGRLALDLLRRIHAVHPWGVVAVLTSCDLTEYREAALAGGARHFISKSVPNGKTILRIVDAEMIHPDHGAKTGKESTMTTQDKFQRLAEARLQELIARIEQLKAQAKQADAEARIEIDRHVKRLSEQKDTIQSKLTQMKNAGESAFADLKAGLEMAMKDMKTALEEAKAKFED